MILQVFAEDKDIGIVSGRVCKYIVEGYNLPFTVSEAGIVSLDFPLGPEAYDLYEFQVDAVDCAGMMSIKSTKVSIAVETACHEGKKKEVSSFVEKLKTVVISGRFGPMCNQYLSKFPRNLLF